MAAIISVIPIILLFVLMMGFKVSGWKSALTTLVVTILLALFAAPSLGIVPEKYANVSIHSITLWSVVEGFLKACFPIILIIICAIFSYNILCETKEIETIKTQFIQLTSDKGLLVLLLTWGFGVYINNFSRYNLLYGSIGTLLLLMLWIYFSCIVLLVGYELNISIYNGTLRGKRRVARRELKERIQIFKDDNTKESRESGA